MIFFDDISGNHTHHQIIEIYALVAAVADVRISITVLGRFDVCQGQRGCGGCPGGSHLLLGHAAIGGRYEIKPLVKEQDRQISLGGAGRIIVGFNGRSEKARC